MQGRALRLRTETGWVVASGTLGRRLASLPGSGLRFPIPVPRGLHPMSHNSLPPKGASGLEGKGKHKRSGLHMHGKKPLVLHAPPSTQARQ